MDFYCFVNVLVLSVADPMGARDARPLAPVSFISLQFSAKILAK